MRILIVEAGMAGLSAALMLGRAGHDVVLLDRDAVFRKRNWEESLLDKQGHRALFSTARILAAGSYPFPRRLSRMFTNRFWKPALSSYARIAPELNERYTLACVLDAIRNSRVAK